MIIDKKVDVVVNGSNIGRYKEKYGHDIKIGQIIEIDVDDLSNYSGVKINCECEICKKISKIKKQTYTTGKEKGGYYCCNKCSISKFKNICIVRYGVENPGQSRNIKDKIRETNLSKYGVENPFQLEEFKNKIKETNLSRYGSEYPLQSIIIKEKVKKTNLKKYGVCHVFQSIAYRESCINRYGVDNPMKNLGIFKKSQKSGYKIKSYNDNLYYQGTYELDFLNFCKKLNIIDLIERGPTIKYNDSYVYFPDFFIEKYNLIVEIKSTYTYNLHKDKNEKKREACTNYGYDFLFITDKNYIEFLTKLN